MKIMFDNYLQVVEVVTENNPDILCLQVRFYII